MSGRFRRSGGRFTFERECGGHRQYAAVRLVVTDAPRFAFMSIAQWPHNIHARNSVAGLEAAIRLGIVEVCEREPTHGLQVVLDAVGYDPGRSSEMAFKIAASVAVQQFLNARRQ